MTKSWFIFLCLFICTSFASDKALSDPMNVNASLLGNMARLEFSMKNLDDNIEIKQNKNDIHINFNKKIYTDPLLLAKLAPGYIKNAHLSKDLTTIIIKTTKEYPINNLLLDNTLFLELIGSPETNFKEIKTSAKKEKEAYFPPLQSKNQDKDDLPATPMIDMNKNVLGIISPEPELNLEIDSGPDKSILGFLWNKRVPFSVESNQKGLNIRFKANIEISNKDVVPLLDKNLSSFNAANKNKTLNIFIPVPKGYEYKISERGSDTFVIVNKKQGDVKKAAVAKKDVTKQKATLSSPKQKAIAKKTAELPKKKPAKKAETKKTAKQENKIATKAEKQNLDIKTIKISNKDKKTEDAPKSEEALIDDTAVSSKITTKKDIIASDIEMHPEPSEEIKEITSYIAKPEINDDDRTFSLSFPWNRDTAAALFKKQGYWWIVFDRKAEIDFSLLKRLGGDVVLEIVQLPGASSTMIRMIIDSNYNPTVRKEGLLWIMDIVPRETGPSINLDVEPQLKSETGPRLFIPTTGIGTMQKMSDPLYGDSFTVIPVYGLGWGIAQRREYPNLILPKTIQGVVVETLSPDVIVKTNKSGIEISRIPGGLSLSSDAIVAIENEIDYTMEGLDKLFDLSAFKKEDGEEYQEALPSFLARVTVGTKEQKNYQRLNLAKYYLANGYTPEALSVLKTMEQDDYEVTQTPAYLAVRGMANVMFNRPDLTIDNLNREIFDNSDMAKVWLAAAYAQKEDYNPAQFNVFKKYVTAVRSLPYDTRAKIAILAARTALNQEDEATMETFLEMLIPEKNNPYQQAAYDYYKGVHSELVAAFKEAGEHFEAAQNSPSQLYFALAGKELAKLKYKLDMISLDELARILERNRYAWRGDEIEYDTMMELVDIYMENQRYPEALRKMDEITTSFPKHPKTKGVQQRAVELFNDLYMNDKSHNIDPVKAIALFNDFPNLIPENEVGNDMVKKLADRLVSVDLLNNAITLLEKQMNSKALKGQQRNEIGTRLALVYLLNDQPEQALNALDNSIFFPISASINSHRTIIRAKALASIGNVNEAIELLSLEKNENAQKLKIDIYWAEKDWESVSDAIKPLIKKPIIGKALDEEQSQLLIAWATAMRLANNETGLARLRENFIAYMKDTPYYQPFNVITSPSDEMININNLQNQIKMAQNFATFLNTYTDDLKENNLSDIVK